MPDKAVVVHKGIQKGRSHWWKLGRLEGISHSTALSETQYLHNLLQVSSAVLETGAQDWSQLHSTEPGCPSVGPTAQSSDQFHSIETSGIVLGPVA